MARLIVNDGRSVELAVGEAVKIGRDPTNEIALPDESKASRRHCQVIGVRAGAATRYELTDLGSTNKTRIGGKVVERKILAHGDTIEIGTTTIRFEDESEEKMFQEAGSQGVCFLEWVSKERKGERVLLKGPRTTLGRRESSTIVLDDRMASGHHAEIVRDLNGYTLRDLGSTNGTLVNGEPATEVALSHGARVRIGNSRFVFKDPSMKDIEVELAQFDEDEGWGMLGDVDLSKAKASYGGLLAGLGLLAAAAAGAFFFVQGEDRGGDAAVSVDSNLVADGSFEDESLAWSSSGEDAPVRVSGGGGKPLVVAHTGSAEAGSDEESGADARVVFVTHEERFAGLERRPFQLDARVRASGPADLVAVWTNTVDAGSRVPPIGYAVPIPISGGRARASLAKPMWADRLALAVRVAPGGRLTLESIRLDQAPLDGAPVIVPLAGVPGGAVNATVSPTDGSLDLVEGRLAVRFVGARPIARLADGTVLSRFLVQSMEATGDAVVATGRLIAPGVEGDGASATVRWSVGGGDGVVGKVTVTGAVAGLVAEMPRANLAEGIRLLTAHGPQTSAAVAGADVTSVRKVLAGTAEEGGSGLITWSPADGGASFASVAVADALDPSLIEVRMFAETGEASFHTVTDYNPSRLTAESRLSAARLLRAEQPVAAIAELQAIAQEYPFEDRVRDEALRLAAAGERELGDRADAAALALRRHQIFGSEETLAAASKEIDALAERVGVDGATPPSAGASPLVTRVHELAVGLAEERAAHVASVVATRVGRLHRLATMLEGEPGYEPMAALYLRILVATGEEVADPAAEPRFQQARERLEAIAAEHASILLPDPAAGGR